MSRLLRASVALGLLLLTVPIADALGGPGEDLAACRSTVAGEKQVTIRSDRWVRIGAPKFDAEEGPRTIKAFTTSPYASNAVYVTNGTVVKFSGDGGCTWNTMFRSSALRPGPGYTPDVVTGITAPTDATLWVATYDDIAGVPHPHVYVGTDVGQGSRSPSFSRIDIGMPQYGRPVTLIGSTQPTSGAFLLVDELPDPSTGTAATTTRHLYQTYLPDDPQGSGAVTGAAWQEIAPPTGFGRIEGIAGQDNNTVWIWNGNKFAVSSDTDTSPITWTVGTAPNPIVKIDIDSDLQPIVVSRGDQGSQLQVASAAAALSRPRGVPGDPVSFTHGRLLDVFAASGPGGTWGFDHRVQDWVNITPRGVPVFSQLEMSNGKGTRVVLGQTPDALYRWDTYFDETFIKPPLPLRGVGDPNRPLLPKSKLKGAVLSPLKQIVEISPGQTKQVPVTFRVPPAPAPLDVYFLMDTTSSMGAAIAGLKASVTKIATDLRAQLGTSACFGVGDVKDFVGASPYVFKTLLPVSPCDTSPGLVRVKAAVAQLKEGTAGDGGFPPEAQTVALTQAVKGNGQAHVPVPAGQGAKFRPAAFKVIVLISDSGPNEGNGYPTVGQTARTLNSDDVKIVSIAVNGPGGEVQAAERMMKRLGEETDSRAPAEGVDCDGDGGGRYGDLGPGDPLVCKLAVLSNGRVPTVNIGPAIIGLLIAVQDPGTVEVDVTDPEHVVRGPILGLTSVVKNLKYESGLSFKLPVGCTSAQAGRELPVGLYPTVRSVSVGLYGQVVVRCLAPAVPPVVRPPEAPPQPAAVAHPLVALAPVVPAPINPPANPISNINPNAGFSQQEEQQFQLASVLQDASEEEQPELAELEMSALPAPSDTQLRAQLALGGAAVVTGFAFAYQRQLQRRSQVRQARI